MTILLLLASLSWGQSTTTALGLEDDLKLQNVRKDVREILVGRPTVTGLPTFKNGIKFGDGTTQTTAASDVGNSTATYVAPDSTSAATANPNVCIPGSTATVTCNTSCRLMAHYQTTHQAGSTSVYANLLFDGAFAPWIATGSNSAPCSTWDNGSSNAGMTCSLLGPAMAAGVHTVCAAVSTSAGGSIRAGQLSVVPVK